MPRRRLSIVLNILLLVLGVLLALVVDYLANTAGVSAPAFSLLQRWALPLFGVALVLIIGVQVWLYLLERPPSAKRTWDSSRPPYPGLESFIEEDAGVFFGREPQIVELLDRLHPTLPNHAHRFVTVIGPSGAGKSSLVQAGLLPRLALRRTRWAIAPPLVPGDQPTQNLARSLAAALPGATPDALAAELGTGPAALVRRVEELRAAAGARSVLLVVDQAEELLTRAGEQERAAFLGLLDGALRDDSRLWVVATLRSEFLTGLLTTGFADLFRSPVVIGSLERAALFQVIEGPAAQAGVTFAPGVVNELVDDTGGGDALPLLAYMLQALYLRVGPGGSVSAEDYRQLSGVAGALSRQADKVTAELQAGDGAAPVLSTLLKFVTVDEAGPTRWRVRRGTLIDAERRVVDGFVTARLLTSDAEGDDTVVEVAHEALFRQWPPLRQAIETRADDLRQRAELERWASDWVRSGRRDSYLLRDERLEIAQQRTAAHGDVALELPLVHEFLGRSRRSDRAALERLSEAVARRALASVDHDPEQGILLALAAIEECAPTRLAQRALLAALAVCPYAVFYAVTSMGSGAWRGRLTVGGS
ncbi:MAG: ATP-binding protein [Egibacteraceae bacterium]